MEFFEMSLEELDDSYLLRVSKDLVKIRNESMDTKITALYAMRNHIDREIERELKNIHKPVFDGTSSTTYE